MKRKIKVSGGEHPMFHNNYHTRPIVSRGEDHVCELPLGESSFVMNIHNPFMHCVTSQYVFKMCDVIMLLHAVTMVTT